MAQVVLAQTFALVCPDRVVEGQHLKLQRRDSDTHVIVEVQEVPEQHMVQVLSFEDGQKYYLDLGTAGPCLQREGPVTPSTLWFLRADIATPQEVNAYVAMRRTELTEASTAATRALGVFEHRVGRGYPST